jgi:transcriptional regulator with XRE-family HTH domain
MTNNTRPVRRSNSPPSGEHLRTWRQRRRLTQLDLALEADISTRHLSFVETSREMVLRLAERLNVPLRERNTLPVAAGYAPMYRERALDDPALATARAAVERKHLLERLRQQIALTADTFLVTLLAEVQANPAPDQPFGPAMEGEHLGVVMPLMLRTPDGVMSFFSTLTVFGSPNDVTLQELAVESFFPADEATAQALRAGQ